MTPAAHHAAAIEILYRILDGTGAEAALTGWGRANRFAGSGDRFAIRDLVFACLRRKRSLAAYGGSMSGRGLVLGLLRQRGDDPATIFTGIGHAPGQVGPEDIGRVPAGAEAIDCPDWLAPRLQAALGSTFEHVLLAMHDRAPTYARVNLRKSTVGKACELLADDGIEAVADSEGLAAIEIVKNARKINASQAFLQGIIELQDRSSQAVTHQLCLRDGHKVLDLCAGAGGKSLAMANHANLSLFAHDIHLHRLKELPERAIRAGIKITILKNPEAYAPYDLVFCDVPCSGSGSWRRDPQGKWALTSEKLTELCALQAKILDQAAPLVQPLGELAYVTCSLLREENEDQISAFLLRNTDWKCEHQQRFALDARGDGFFLARIKRRASGGNLVSAVSG